MDALNLTEDQFSRLMAKLPELLAKAPIPMRPFKLFALDGTKSYGEKVAAHLNMELTPHTEKYHEDGECYVKSGPEYNETGVGNVRGHDVFVIQSLYSDERESVQDKFVKLCMFCGSLKDASAHEVIPIIPNLAWARQDRKTESRAPIGTKYAARMLESVGISRALIFDAHNLAAEQNAFNVPIDNLESKNQIADWCAQQLIAEGRTKNIKVLSPDSGGLSRCGRFRLSLLKRLNQLGAKIDDIEIVIFDKVRIKGRPTGGRIVGDVQDADVLAYDDMISTGGTMQKAEDAVIAHGGRMWAICATHGIFCGKASETFSRTTARLVVTDTVRPFRLDKAVLDRLVIVDTTKMVADAVRRIHLGTGSISELLRA